MKAGDLFNNIIAVDTLSINRSFFAVRLILRPAEIPASARENYRLTLPQSSQHIYSALLLGWNRSQVPVSRQREYMQSILLFFFMVNKSFAPEWIIPIIIPNFCFCLRLCPTFTNQFIRTRIRYDLHPLLRRNSIF